MLDDATNGTRSPATDAQPIARSNDEQLADSIIGASADGLKRYRAQQRNDMAKLPDINDLTGKQLAELIDKARQLQLDRYDEKKQQLRNKWAAEADAEGITLGDIFPPARGRSQPRQSVAGQPGTRTPARDKYRFPDGTTWSGKGRIPMLARPYLDKDGIKFTDTGFFKDKDAGNVVLQKYLIKS